MWTTTSKLALLATAFVAGMAQAAAGGLADDLQKEGKLSVAVYKAFPPFSDRGQGIDIELARALAEKLALTADIREEEARDDMEDDLRNYVWKGHYLRGGTVDVMMHVPVDPVLIKSIPQVHIFAPYQRENLAIVRDTMAITQMPGPAGLEVFTREKIGVERDTLADVYLMSAVGGRLKDNVVHFGKLTLAVEALRKGEIAAIMAPQGELESALKNPGQRMALTPFADPNMPRNGWAMGLAIKSDKPELKSALDKAMAGLVADGTVARIFAKYGVGYRRVE